MQKDLADGILTHYVSEKLSCIFDFVIKNESYKMCV
jgi:hypothetical protein